MPVGTISRFFVLLLSFGFFLTPPPAPVHAQSPHYCDGYARDYARRYSRGQVVGGGARGAIGGAIIGGIAGKRKGARRGAAIGGGVGAIAGGVRQTNDYNALYDWAYRDCMRRR